MYINNYLFGGFNPSEKYARQNGNLPQIGVKIKNIWNHHLVIYYINQTASLKTPQNQGIIHLIPRHQFPEFSTKTKRRVFAFGSARSLEQL